MRRLRKVAGWSCDNKKREDILEYERELESKGEYESKDKSQWMNRNKVLLDVPKEPV